MRLVEEGVLTLNTPVSLVLRTSRATSARSCGPASAHAHGGIHLRIAGDGSASRRTPLQELIAEALASPLQFAPVPSCGDADYNYLIAGHVASVVTGMRSQTWHGARNRRRRSAPDLFPPPPDLQANRRFAVLPPRGLTAMATRHARGLAHPAFGVFATMRIARFGSMSCPAVRDFCPRHQCAR
jgi:CubicO group peptidase (beta-lactamase class C family)